LDAYKDSIHMGMNRTAGPIDPLIAPMPPTGMYEPFVEPTVGQFNAPDGSWQTHSGGTTFGYADFLNLDTGELLLLPAFSTF
jgi:hypothetical protein